MEKYSGDNSCTADPSKTLLAGKYPVQLSKTSIMQYDALVYIQHKWIVLFTWFDWFLNLGISSAIHLLVASGQKKMAHGLFHQKIE